MSWDRRGKLGSLATKENILLALVSVNILFTMFANFGAGKSFILTNGKEAEEPGLEKFCSSFIDQILSKSLHEEMVEADIYDVLVEDNYKVLNLVGSEKTLFTRVNDNNCAVVIKDKLGLRRFDLSVNKSIDYPFFYRVKRVDEPMVEG